MRTRYYKCNHPKHLIWRITDKGIECSDGSSKEPWFESSASCAENLHILGCTYHHPIKQITRKEAKRIFPNAFK